MKLAAWMFVLAVAAPACSDAIGDGVQAALTSDPRATPQYVPEHADRLPPPPPLPPLPPDDRGPQSAAPA